MTIDNIIEEIKKAESIAILTHESPDGDAVGSSLAMYLALKQMGKNPDVIIPKYSKVFSFLPGIEDIKIEGKKDAYDLAISLDCANMKLLNGYANYFEDAKTKISIDHHGTNTMYADYNFVDPASPACAQTLIFILETMNITITKEIGTCLLTGIITDTGGFKYPGVTVETFEFAAGLLAKGINVSDIYKRVLQIRTRANFELSRLSSDRLEFLEDGKLTFSYITLEDQEKVGAEEGDHEGLVNIGRDIEGVEVAVFFHENEKGFKVSMRSDDNVNVSDICSVFGGGGHPRAAGCLISLPLEQAKEKVLREVKRYIK